jgi:Cu(I)-responsive transcriptional regulator
MKIGEVAKQVGITVEAIRFYEKKGLIASPQRNESGYRDYSEDVVQHLFFITGAKELGFSLKEIKDLILLQSTPNTTCKDVKLQAEIKIADIEKKIDGLQKIKMALLGLVSCCPGKGPLTECPIIGSLGAGKGIGNRDND